MPQTLRRAFRPLRHRPELLERNVGVAIFTRDGDAAREFANRVEIGMVGINVPIPMPIAFLSFGGSKRSLFGDMAVYGSERVRFYTRLKTMTALAQGRARQRRSRRTAY